MRKPLVMMLLMVASCACAGADLAARRGDFKRALETAERGPLSDYASIARPMADHPLFPYLEYAHLRRQLDTVAPSRIRRFLDRHATLPIAASLRESWLHALIRRKEWEHFLAFHVPHGDPILRCGALHARLSRGMDAAFLDDAEAAWLSAASVPALCDASFAALKASGRLTPARIWQRIDLALDANNPALARFLARNLDARDRARAESLADFVGAPSVALASGWPDDARSRRVLTQALAGLAQKSPDAAESLLDALGSRIALNASQRGAVLNQIALWSAASYLPDASARFARVPDAAYDERLHEWRAREALARGDLVATRRAIVAMTPAQREDPRWRYIDARMAQKQGETTAPRAVFSELAQAPTYYGFLAADQLGQAYALCPIEADGDAAQRALMAQHSDLQRALELHAIQREGWARREWDAALPALTPRQRRVAVALAHDAGWFDRAVFTLREGDDMRLYALRFPLPHARHLRDEAKKHGVDPAWVAALIRAESAWISDAHSHANARGLMQLLPSTARAEARRLGITYVGDAALFQPLGNIVLGTAHLGEMLRSHGGRPYLATAAYNAGAAPVARWLAQRAPRDPDLWIETIPYRETRDYVARILAFSVIYDWRLHGKAVPVSRRMRGDDVARVARRDFLCPTSTPVAFSP